MTSSRLPGKVLLPALGRPMLAHLVRRLRTTPSVDDVVLATTVNADDDVLVEFAKRENLRYFRGSEDDVMQRVIDAAHSADAELVVEITGDCPIIDPQIVEQVIRTFHANPGVAYASNAHVRSYPDGMDAQVFRLDTLKASAEMTQEALDHEHVTLHIRNHPEIFPHVHVVAPPEIHWPELGLTLDEPRDYELLTRIIDHFGDANYLFGCVDAVRLLRANPEWVAINQAVTRKGDT
jgi:spore coat polysaccharide biosynthesis protein SpsF